jgi:hypothetical protein
MNLIIHDLLGYIVLHKISLKKDDPVDINNIISGTYFYRLMTNRGLYAGKIVKL